MVLRRFQWSCLACGNSGERGRLARSVWRPAKHIPSLAVCEGNGAPSRRFDEYHRETISQEAWRETHHAATGTVALPRSLSFWALIR
jgi:hypothetical protein